MPSSSLVICRLMAPVVAVSDSDYQNSIMSIDDGNILYFIDNLRLICDLGEARPNGQGDGMSDGLMADGWPGMQAKPLIWGKFGVATAGEVAPRTAIRSMHRFTGGRFTGRMPGIEHRCYEVI